MNGYKFYTLVFSIWILLGLIFGVQSYIFYSLQATPNCGLLYSITCQLPNCALWGIYSILIFKLPDKYFITRNNLKILLTFHLPFASFLVLFHIVLLSTVRWLFRSYGYAAQAVLPLMSYIEYYMENFLYLQFSLYVAVYATAHASKSYSKYKAKEMETISLGKSLHEVELNFLRMQLNPHFLFNTLNTVSMLVRQRDEKKATEVISGLCDLLRTILASSKEQWTTLGRELELVEKYLSIEKIRFGSKFNYSLLIQDDLKNIIIPHLILQPLVENSIKHGFNELRLCGAIEIKAIKDDSSLVIHVIDDGIGFKSNYQKGIGLGSIEERIQKIYTDKGKCIIDTEKKTGAKVTLVLPLLTQ